MGEINDISRFAVDEDGTILRFANERFEDLNRDLLEVLAVGSASQRILAAYDAREIAYEICKSRYGRKNYKDYVEMVMRKYCPNEYEKAKIGKRYKVTTRFLIFMPWFFMFLVPIMIFLKNKYKKLCGE